MGLGVDIKGATIHSNQFIHNGLVVADCVPSVKVIEMASSKYKRFFRKNLNSELCVVISSLRKENAYLKKTLFELSHQHSEHNKLVERFLSLETVLLEGCQQVKARNEIDLPSEQLSKKEGKQTASTSDEWASTNNLIELQRQLNDALEKNKQWLEYDQQREAYVRAILDRMLWLEKQLNEANQALSQRHNEDHSDEKEQMCQILEVLWENFDMIYQLQITFKKWYEEELNEVKQLKQQQNEKMCGKSAEDDHHCSEDEEQQLRDETEDLQRGLDEKCCSANSELEADLCQLMLNHQQADQEKITDLERQIKISSQDLEDERQNCSYLKKQMVKVLKMLQKTKDRLTKLSKGEQQDRSSCEAAYPPSLPSRDSLTSSPCSSLLNESFLECPSCQAKYPASHYRELLNHLEICLD